MRRVSLFGLGLIAVLLIVTHPLKAARPEQAQTPTPRPFSLPFAGPSGPSTWYLGQGYGNTIGAYFQRDTTYRAGQGLHFGVDFAAPCGTPVLAIGDGTVALIDAPEHGALPHNLLLQLDAG